VLERVRFPGQVKLADLPAYYHAADLYVSASHSDGSSISLLEALACGRPALVSDIPGNREWITPGEQGWWFQEGDPDSLAQSLVKAYESRSSLPEMGQQARLTATARANWQANFPKLLDLYQIALS
jgi:L-malate glycosyltransferase